jgi:AcrR family transcriptional regulator
MQIPQNRVLAPDFRVTPRDNTPCRSVSDLRRLADDRGLDPLHELARTIREGVQAFEANTERRRILTILWLRCEYVGEMLPALERRQRADAAMQQLFVEVIALAAARGRLARGWSPEMAGRALLLLVNGTVEHWLRAPGNARLEPEVMSLATAFLETIREPVAAAANQ